MKRFLLTLGVALSVSMTGFISSSASAATTRNAEGYIEWSRVGAATMNLFQGGGSRLDLARVYAMRQMGVSEPEIAQVLLDFRAKNFEEGVIRKGDKFKTMSFANKKEVKVMRNVILTAEGEYRVWRMRTKSGLTITFVEKCANVGIEETPPAPPAKENPPPVEETPPAPLTPFVPPTTVEEGQRLCNKLRVNGVLGFEWEPLIHGSDSRSLYAAAGIYCMRLTKYGQIGFGLGGQAAFYGGKVKHVGRFRGHLYGAGPAVMIVNDKGLDYEGKLMIMDYASSYRQGGYRSHEHRTVIGLSLAHNDYRGRIDGTGKPETQYFALCGVPIGGHTTETWNGQKIGNGSKLGLVCNAGLRKYLTEGKKWNPYIQGGLLGEARKGGADFLSGSLRLGASNKHRTIGCGAGIDVNLLKGGIHPGLGCWVDVAGMVRHKRTASRAAAIAADQLPATKNE